MQSALTPIANGQLVGRAVGRFAQPQCSENNTQRLANVTTIRTHACFLTPRDLVPLFPSLPLRCDGGCNSNAAHADDAKPRQWQTGEGDSRAIAGRDEQSRDAAVEHWVALWPACLWLRCAGVCCRCCFRESLRSCCACLHKSSQCVTLPCALHSSLAHHHGLQRSSCHSV